MDGVETTTELTTTGSSRPEDRGELAEAAYLDLINTVQSGVPASDILFGESERASYFRGLLLDQPKDQGGASYDDLWTGRGSKLTFLGLAMFPLISQLATQKRQTHLFTIQTRRLSSGFGRSCLSL
jgi:hypothetical protein